MALTPLTAMAQDDMAAADSATMGGDVIVFADLAERLSLTPEVRERIRPHVVALGEQLAMLADLEKRKKTGQLTDAERTEVKAKITEAREAVSTHKRAVKESLTEQQRETFGAYVRERATALGIDLERREGEKMEKKEP